MAELFAIRQAPVFCRTALARTPQKRVDAERRVVDCLPRLTARRNRPNELRDWQQRGEIKAFPERFARR